MERCSLWTSLWSSVLRRPGQSPHAPELLLTSRAAWNLVLTADPERRGGRSLLFVLAVVLAGKGQVSLAPWSPWYNGTDLVKEMNGSGFSTVIVKRRRSLLPSPRRGGFGDWGSPIVEDPIAASLDSSLLAKLLADLLPVNSSAQTAAFSHLRTDRAPQRPDPSSAGLPECLSVGLCLPCALSAVSRRVSWQLCTCCREQSYHHGA